MENQNTQPQTQIVPPAPVSLPPNAQVPQVEVDAKNFKAKLQNLTKNLKEKFNSYPKRTQTLILVVGVLFAIIFLLLVLAILVGPKKGKTPVLQPSPSPISLTPAPEVILNASKYATDSGVLKIEDDLNNFQKQLDGSDVRQTDLNIPSIDYNINFNQ